MDFVRTRGDAVEGFCVVKAVDKKLNVKGQPYLDMTLCDRTGEINAKLWDYKSEVHGIYEVGDIIKVRGVISKYNSADQLRIDKIRPVFSEDNVDISKLVPSAEYSGEMMYEKLRSTVSSLEDEQLKKLTLAILADNRERLTYCPAAYKLHHAYRGGLLYHTLSIIAMAKCVCDIYPSVDRDLLICGAALHDICKTDEFETNANGLVTRYSVKGELLGHLVMGAMVIRDKARELNVDEKTAVLLEHMIISHHGSPEFGAAVRPMFLEAEILSQLDNLDAEIFEITEAAAGVDSEAFTQRMWSLDNRKLFNHARKPLATKANLFDIL